MTSIASTARSAYHHLRRCGGDLIFEWRYGVRTNGRIELAELGLGHDERDWYSPANWSTLRRILPGMNVGSDDVFLDLGSGMGRMVLEAARHPFRRVIGVELAPHLHEIALANVARTRQRRRCGEIELVCGDVLEYVVPDDVTVVFMNNPFHGRIFQGAVDNLLASYDRRPRRISVIYYAPVEESILLDTGRFRLVQTVRRLRAADPLRTTHVYAVTPAASTSRPGSAP